MFGTKTKSEPIVRIPKPTIAVVLKEEAPAEHTQLRAELGIPEFPTLVAFCHAKGIPNYDIAEVSAYLQKMIGDFGWFPLRPADTQTAGFRCNTSTPSWGFVYARAHLYDQVVPIPVLLRVKDVLAQFPATTFFVSDAIRSSDVVVSGDPFLLAVLGTERCIIDQWDEPGFNRKEQP